MMHRHVNVQNISVNWPL